MTKTPIPINKIFTTVGELETECNFIELVFPGNLISLSAVGDADKHITEGIFDRLSFDEFKEVKDKLGKLKFKLDNGGTNTAWINGVKIKVSFTK